MFVHDPKLSWIKRKLRCFVNEHKRPLHKLLLFVNLALDKFEWCSNNSRNEIAVYSVFSADEDIDSTFATNVVVSSNGDCLWVPPGIFFSTCKINIKWFPFDDQTCEMKFGSWTYDSSGIDLRLVKEEGDTSTFSVNGEWLLLGRWQLFKLCSIIDRTRVIQQLDFRQRSGTHGIHFVLKNI